MKPSATISREDQARKEVGYTDITRPLAVGLVSIFCLCIALVPLGQRVINGSHTSGRGNLFEKIPQAIAEGDSMFAANRLILAALEDAETALEEESFLRDLVLPPVQAWMLRWLKSGNEQAIPGREGWLFYAPDVKYVTQRGWAEPLNAIRDFRDQLAERNIQLLLVPTPVKPAVYPEKFSSRTQRTVVHHADYHKFLKTLDEHGIEYFDPADLLRDMNEVSYLETDTHWTFSGMEAAAKRLADMLSPKLKGVTAVYQRESVTVTNHGDIVAMLNLPDEGALFDPQIQKLEQVVTPNAQLWKSDKEAEVLLLGDSFSNIFSLEGMGWGPSAGFAEQLSFHLQRPVDAILQNDQGSLATRKKLSTELARGRDRLGGKKVVVWQFAVRELVQGDWQRVPLDLGTPQPSSFYVPEEGTTVQGEGVIAAISSSPKPGRVPYKDNIITLHVVDLDLGDGGGLKDALIYTWGMQDNQLTPASGLRVGDRIAFEFSPWFDVEDQYSGYRRTLLDDQNIEFEEPCWAPSINRL